MAKSYHKIYSAFGIYQAQGRGGGVKKFAQKPHGGGGGNGSGEGVVLFLFFYFLFIFSFFPRPKAPLRQWRRQQRGGLKTKQKNNA